MVYQDLCMKALAEYLSQELNQRFYPDLAVKTWRDFNSLREPLSNLPLLKCYRERDVFLKNMNVSRTDVIIEYDVVYPKDTTFSAYCVMVGQAIADLLVYPKCYDITGLKTVSNFNDTEIRYNTEFNSDYQATTSTAQVRATFYTYTQTSN